MLLRRSLLALLVAGTMSACSVGPDYVRPTTAIPDQYQGQTLLQSRVRNGLATADLSQWWTGFGDSQLTRLVALALQQNLDLAQAKARLQQAQAAVGAANAALLPSASVSGQAARAYQSVETPLGQVLNSRPGFDRDGHAYATDLNASWELDIFGGLRRGREAALADYQTSEAGVAAVQLAVAAQVADTYISIRGLQGRLRNACEQVQNQQALLDLSRRLLERGLLAQMQVKQMEASLAQFNAAIPALSTALEVAMNAMDVMLAAPPGTYAAELKGAQAIPQPPQFTDIGAPAQLLRRRPDVIAAERRLASANARIGVAVAEYYPKLSLSGLIGSATSVSSANLFSSGANQASGALGLRWRLFDFGRINAQIEQAKGQEAEMLAAYRLAALKATEDVENALSALTRREQQAAFLSQGVQSLSQARASTFAAYRRGTASMIDVLQADENVLRSTDAQIQARAEAARAAVLTFKALGGGWQPPSRSEGA
ncbi:efflux transporter outer membrane subunit [Herbaspirillum sp. RV1423]|uniref:efflux transporter outer membrane subunit n=1 Tax=Herbaspirillum sp. RV1423 TaxID=1443993 RepID=UPI000554D13C|nr:efflux transporter outer membrane subunit [Herbaspirillum sp. RV1423]